MSDLISRQAAIDAIKSRKTAEQSSAGIMMNAVVDFCIDIVKNLPSVHPQPEEDCDTCKHGFFGSRQCDNCRVRYLSHYEREEEHYGSD